MRAAVDFLIIVVILIAIFALCRANTYFDCADKCYPKAVQSDLPKCECKWQK